MNIRQGAFHASSHIHAPKIRITEKLRAISLFTAVGSHALEEHTVIFEICA
jgi:hypothetical protein